MIGRIAASLAPGQPIGRVTDEQKHYETRRGILQQSPVCLFESEAMISNSSNLSLRPDTVLRLYHTLSDAQSAMRSFSSSLFGELFVCVCLNSNDDL